MSIAYIDWGGTHFRCVVDGASKTSFEKSSSEIDIECELTRLFEFYPDISSVGISFAGQVYNNTILSAPNINAKEINLQDKFKDKTIIVQNDLKCAALAEADYFGERDIAALYVGTGIGSAYIANGALLTGCGNLAGEIGHIPYIKTKETCGCGKNNCLELHASGSGIYKKAIARGLGVFTIDELQCSEDGKIIVDEFVCGVGYGASMIITLLNPKVLVIGGGIVETNKWLLDSVKQYVDNNAFKKSAEACEIKLSKLKNGSLDGARLLALGAK